MGQFKNWRKIREGMFDAQSVDTTPGMTPQPAQPPRTQTPPQAVAAHKETWERGRMPSWNSLSARLMKMYHELSMMAKEFDPEYGAPYGDEAANEIRNHISQASHECMGASTMISKEAKKYGAGGGLGSNMSGPGRGGEMASRMNPALVPQAQPAAAAPAAPARRPPRP